MTIMYQGLGSIIPKVIEADNPHNLIGTTTPRINKTNLGGVFKFSGPMGCFYAFKKNIEGLSTNQIEAIIDSALRGILDIGRVYLSGAITGNDDAHCEFLEAEDQLAQLGYETFNPMSLQGKYRTEQQYMKRDILELAKCEFICFVNEFSETSNANLEESIARACGIKELSL